MPPAALAPPSSAAVRSLLAQWGKSAGDPRMAVAPGDEMLGFLRDSHDGDGEQALCAYYRSGASIAAVLVQVLRWRFGDARRTPSLLDFASGYGRVTRFLLDEVPPGAVTVADVLPGAVAFQRQALGVRAVPSSARPEELGLPGGFGAILVTSLFTHLPEAPFGAWLGALLARLAPGGVLAFSTHDLALLPPEQRPPAGLCFQPRSEIAELATADYGSTWVDEPFVRAALGATGVPLAALRFERALCNYQDLWVVVPDPSETFDGLALQSEPEVVVERFQLTSRELLIEGWAHARYGDVASVEASLDGAVLGRAPVAHPREDVAVALGPAARRSGWDLRAPLPEGASPGESVLVLRALDGAGTKHPVWVGRPLTAALQAGALQARQLRASLHHLDRRLAAHQDWAAQEIAILQGRIAAMEASRFWKLRNAWFRLKRALRLTDES